MEPDIRAFSDDPIRKTEMMPPWRGQAGDHRQVSGEGTTCSVLTLAQNMKGWGRMLCRLPPFLFLLLCR